MCILVGQAGYGVHTYRMSKIFCNYKDVIQNCVANTAFTSGGFRITMVLIMFSLSVMIPLRFLLQPTSAQVPLWLQPGDGGKRRHTEGICTWISAGARGGRRGNAARGVPI